MDKYSCEYWPIKAMRLGIIVFCTLTIVFTALFLLGFPKIIVGYFIMGFISGFVSFVFWDVLQRFELSFFWSMKDREAQRIKEEAFKKIPRVNGFF